MRISLSLICGICTTLSFAPVYGQFNLDGQYVVRSEIRNGYGQPIREDSDLAAFVAHRARLQAGYQKDAFSFYASVQDIRTWGSTPQTKVSDDFLSVHEAWLETKLGDRWKIKLGRQELNFDNARFLGNLDWALQGRAHDFALVKYEENNLKLQFGGGFNQDAQKLDDNTFRVPNQYKTAQLARLENSVGNLQYSVLFWNDGRQFNVADSAGTTINKGVRHRQTIGMPTLRYKAGNTLFSGFYYYQLGRDLAGRKVKAYDLSAQVTQQVQLDSLSGRMLRLTGGFEILSGTASNSSVNRSFSPLYGTNHMHNGYMDLFYVGGAHENNVGLQDYYLRTRLDFSPKFFTQLDGHAFLAQADVLSGTGQNLEKYLGTELDLTVGHVFNEAISLQAGYSQFFFSDTFEAVQRRGTLKNSQNWGYLMLIFRPTMKNKFIGLLL